MIRFQKCCFYICNEPLCSALGIGPLKGNAVILIGVVFDFFKERQKIVIICAAIIYRSLINVYMDRIRL